MFFFSYVPAAKEKVSPVPLSSSTTYYSTLKWYKDPFRSLTWCLSLFLSAKLHQLFFFFLRRDCKKTKRFEMLSNRRDLCLSLHSRRVRVYYCMYFTPFFLERKENIDRRWWAMIIRERRTEHAKRRGKKRENLFSFLFLFYTCIDASPKVSSRVHTWSESWLELFSFNSKKTKYPCPPLLFQRLLCVCVHLKRKKKMQGN